MGAPKTRLGQRARRSRIRGRKPADPSANAGPRPSQAEISFRIDSWPRVGGQDADTENLLHAKRIADKLFGSDYQWSVMAEGKHQMPFATKGAINGANVRVGLEDSPFVGKGKLAQSNAEQVRAMRAILGNLSLEIASPDEARQMLKLKGGDLVNF